MAYLAGIDEAGFGPLLGPLVVTATVFRTEDASRDFWEQLTGLVDTKRQSAQLDSLLVNDSKKLFNQKTGVKRLEEAAHAFLRLRDKASPDFQSLLANLESPYRDELADYPWYLGKNFALPVEADEARIQTHAERLAHELASRKISFCGVRCLPVYVGRFNRMLRETDNKSVALFRFTAVLIRQLWDTYSERSITVYCDKQGGRNFYAPLLSELLPEAKIKPVEESGTASVYQIFARNRLMEIHFTVDGDSTYMPTALASMFSKYVRELHMKLLNQYWQAQLPGLKPTAGYYVDGMRFLQDTAALRTQLQTPEGLLVREK